MSAIPWLKKGQSKDNKITLTQDITNRGRGSGLGTTLSLFLCSSFFYPKNGIAFLLPSNPLPFSYLSFSPSPFLYLIQTWCKERRESIFAKKHRGPVLKHLHRKHLPNTKQCLLHKFYGEHFPYTNKYLFQTCMKSRV